MDSELAKLKSKNEHLLNEKEQTIKEMEEINKASKTMEEMYQEEIKEVERKHAEEVKRMEAEKEKEKEKGKEQVQQPA